MDISADVAAIVEQASEWNFAGDCALLELMKRISQVGVELREKSCQFVVITMFYRIFTSGANKLVVI